MSRNWFARLFQHASKNRKNGEAPNGEKPPSQCPQYDATAHLAGQPYLLPRGLIHLVVKPATSGGTAAQGGGTSTANTNNAATGSGAQPTVFTISGTVTQSTSADNSAKPSSGATDSGKTADTGTTAVTYQISVDVVYVPDITCGPFLAHYRENPLFAENITIGVTADGLLTTATSSSTDQTPQIIANIVQTGIDILTFGAQLPLGAGAVARPLTKMGAGEKETTITPKSIKYVKYKRLDIDVIFDPFDKGQVDNVKRLFEPIVQTDPGFQMGSPYDPTETSFPRAKIGSDLLDEKVQKAITSVLNSDVGGQTYYISPFNFDIVTRIGAGLRIGGAPQDPRYSGRTGLSIVEPGPSALPDLRSKFPKNNLGLLFREPTPVQITLTQNSEDFRTVAGRVCAFNFYRLRELHSYTDYPSAEFLDEVAALDAFVNLVKADAADPKSLPGDVAAFSNIVNKLQPSVLNLGKTFQSADDFLATLVNHYAGADTTALASTLVGDAKALQTVIDPLAKDERIFPNLDTMTAYQNEITNERAALFSTASMPSRTARLIKSVPNPYRMVAIEIKRRPFVANSGLNLTISNGMLTQLNINKQSEILGFTQIPLNIAQALMSVPNNLLTVRTQNLTDKGALVNAQNSLVNTQDSAQLQQNTALLNAQAAQLNAQAAKLKAEAALNSAKMGN